MTNEEFACWTLMANSLRSILPLIEAAADQQDSARSIDLPFRAMANGLGFVIAIEELVRPTQQEQMVS